MDATYTFYAITYFLLLVYVTFKCSLMYSFLIYPRHPLNSDISECHLITKLETHLYKCKITKPFRPNPTCCEIMNF